jgi:hypothetical protein
MVMVPMGRQRIYGACWGRKVPKYSSNTLRIDIQSSLKEASRILSNLPNRTAEAKEAVDHIDAAIRLIED